MAAPHTNAPADAPPTPTGVKVLCALGALSVVFGVVGSLALAMSGAALGVLLLCLALGRGAVLWGLWTMRPWAWTWATALYGLGAVVGLVRLDALAVVVNAVIVAYLLFVSEHYRSRSLNPRVE